FAAEGSGFMFCAITAYILDGTGWILYFLSVMYGSITIVGTLSAAYPALTVLFAMFFLGEELLRIQYLAFIFVIFACLGLSYSPPSDDPDAKVVQKRWIPLAIGALVLWGAAQTIVKYAGELPNANDANFALFNTIG